MQNLPDYLNELDIKITENIYGFVNFWTDFSVNEYFYNTRGYIKINCLKLSNNWYMVIIPTKDKSKVVLNVDINEVIKK